MKKQILLFAVCAMMASISVTGCKKKETVDLTGIHTTEAATVAETMAETTAAVMETTEAETESAGTSASEVVNVRAKIATEKKEKVSIEYPVLSNLRNAKTEETVNALVKEYALKILDAYEIDPSKDNVTLACDVIALDRSKGVFVFDGSMKTDGAAYPTGLFYTLTVDLSRGIVEGLTDYADPYTMAGYIISEDCILTKAADEKAAKEYFSGLEVKELWETLKNCDFNSQTDDSFPQAFSYEIEGIIYIAVPVPHALGDYVIVEFHPETK